MNARSTLAGDGNPSLEVYSTQIQTLQFWWSTNGGFQVLLIVCSKSMAQDALKNSREHTIHSVALSQRLNL